MNEQVLDHLFRHQYGKMVSILTKVFGLRNLELIEDAVQDTFINAMVKWRTQMPDNPEGWLMRAAKNRAIDLFRKVKADNNRIVNLGGQAAINALDEFFLEHEIEDSQLRMIFTACHPLLHPKDQIAFALKTIAGFSQKEIAAALLLKEETVKKRLSRARKAVKDKAISFELPNKKALTERLNRVLEVIYLIFNEGFHSSHNTTLVRKELCGEALRLMQMVLKKELLRTGGTYALFALMCFHAARLESKVSENFESIDLRNQDRNQWYAPLIQLGNEAMHTAITYKDYTYYHIEASIAIEHLKAPSYEATNWAKILELYEQLYKATQDPITILTIAFIHIQLNDNNKAVKVLNQIKAKDLEQRAYLYYGVQAEIYKAKGQLNKAVACLDQALEKVINPMEKAYLNKKRDKMENIL